MYTDYSQGFLLAEVLEIGCYLEDDAAPQTEVFDVLDWWKDHGIKRYPIVARMARNVLATPTCGRLHEDFGIFPSFTQEKHVRPEEEEAENDVEQGHTDLIYLYVASLSLSKLLCSSRKLQRWWMEISTRYSFISCTSNYTQFMPHPHNL